WTPCGRRQKHWRNSEHSESGQRCRSRGVSVSVQGSQEPEARSACSTVAHRTIFATIGQSYSDVAGVTNIPRSPALILASSASGFLLGNYVEVLDVETRVRFHEYVAVHEVADLVEHHGMVLAQRTRDVGVDADHHVAAAVDVVPHLLHLVVEVVA